MCQIFKHGRNWKLGTCRKQKQYYCSNNSNNEAALEARGAKPFQFHVKRIISMYSYWENCISTYLISMKYDIQWIIGAWHPSHWCQQLHQQWMRMLSKMFQITHETTLAMTRSKFPDFSLIFPNIFNFPWPITKFPDNSLTFAWYGISLTFPWPLDTLSIDSLPVQ